MHRFLSRFLTLGALALVLAPALHAQSRWTSRNPAPSRANLAALAGGNGLYIAVGGSGLILTSPDGVTWESSVLFSKENLNNVSYAGGSFFARGDSGTVFVSSDGKTWHQRVNGNVVNGPGPLGHAAAAGNSAWVLSSGNNSYSNIGLLASTDATTFTLVASVPTRSVAFGAGKFVAVMGTAFNTSTDGLNWTSFTPTGLTAADELCFGAGRFLARYGQKLFRSDDALQWTEIPSVTASALTFAKDRFIAQSAATGGPIISLDGITWTAPTDSVISIPPSHIVTNGTNFAAFDGYKLYTSTDALHWTQRGTDFTTIALDPGLAFAAGRFLTTDGHTSADGVTWTTDGYAIPAELALDSHVHATNDRFFIFARHTAFTSTDGRAGHRLSDFSFNPRDVAFGASRYVIVGFNDAATEGRLATSTDGETWTEVTLPSGVLALHHVAYGGGLFVALNSYGQIYTSPDGLVWTRRLHPVSTQSLESIAYGAGRWIIAGNPSLTSTDGVLWSHSSAPDATSVAFANGTFVLSAYTGSTFNYYFRSGVSIATSPDGVNWTYRDSDQLYARSFAFGAGSWVGIGSNGRLIQSSATDFARAPAFATGLSASLDPANSQHLTLSAPATGTAPVSYQWTRTYGAQSISTTSTLDLPNWTNFTGEIVLLTASNDYGTVYLPYRLPYRTTQLDPTDPVWPIRFNARLLADGSLGLDYTDTSGSYQLYLGLGPIDFQWFKDGVAIPGANTASITLPYNSATDATAIYSLKITNLFGSVFYDRSLQPSVLRAPSAAQVVLGTNPELLMEVRVPLDSGDVTFTWTKDGKVVKTDVIGANSGYTLMDALRFTSFTASDYGLYRVTVTTAFGTVASNYFTVGAPTVSRLTNLSARAHVGTGDDVLIAGYVGSGLTGGPHVLIRGIGPALSGYGVASPLPRAHLGLNNSAGVSLLVNDHWDASPGYDATFLRDLFAQIGAFPLAAGSFNAAVYRPGPLNADQPPRFTAILSGTDNTTGVGLVELYETVPTAQRLTNLSARARVGSGEDILIAGFVIAGTQPLKVLIRGVGPSLAKHGITQPLKNPKIILYNAAGEAIHNNDQWPDARNLADLRTATTATGAFALDENSADAAMLETLDPGVYSVHVTSVDGSSGIALVEIYEAP